MAEAREHSLLRNIQTISSAHSAFQLNENQSFFSGSNAARADSLTTLICLQPSLKICAAIPTINLSAPMAYSGTTLFYQYLRNMYISLKKSHAFWSYKGNFLFITYLLRAHYMTHLFHLHSSNYIIIITSSNNEICYTIICVLLLLIPSIGQIWGPQ